ncbi:MAG: phosphoribosylglycinamide formyltransferase [Anaeroplasmataceae bacterium]
MKNIVVFASGSGSNFNEIAKACIDKRIDAYVSLLVCDKPNAFVIERANKLNIEVLVLNLKDCINKVEYETIIVNKLKSINPDLICLAGYMKKCDATLLNEFKGKIINIHPALLPSFKGATAVKDAFEFGVKVYGVTVHFVDEEFDNGKIISQRAFEYNGNDINEIFEKIHQIEHELFIESINLYFNNN